jgi:hypothetical protein
MSRTPNDQPVIRSDSGAGDDMVDTAALADASVRCSTIDDQCNPDSRTAPTDASVFGPQCLLHWNPNDWCGSDPQHSLNPYNNLRVGICGSYRVAAVGFVDTGYAYYYDLATDELAGIEFWSAHQELRGCVAGRVSSLLGRCAAALIDKYSCDAGS